MYTYFSKPILAQTSFFILAYPSYKYSTYLYTSHTSLHVYASCIDIPFIPVSSSCRPILYTSTPRTDYVSCRHILLYSYFSKRQNLCTDTFYRRNTSIAKLVTQTFSLHFIETYSPYRHTLLANRFFSFELGFTPCKT